MTEITVGIAYSDKDASDPAYWPGGYGGDVLIEYTREHDICTGVGTIDFILGAEAYPPEIWSKVWVASDLGFLSRYNVVSVEKKAPDGVWLISCQDDSKRMMDYFIDAQYEITYPSTSVYWMKKFLDEAGIAYEIADDYGVMMSENTSLGMTSCYDVITQLCQMNGWAFEFTMDEDPPNFYSSVCHIGKFSITENQSGGAHIDEDRVIELSYNKSDKMLRNRAVVWGAGDPTTGAWVWADTSTTTAWNRPGGDYRTIVYANGLIKTFGIAYSLATTLLNEFSQTIPEKSITCFYNYGDAWKTNEEGEPIPKTYSELVNLGYYVHLMSNVNAFSPKHSIYVGGRVTHLTERMDSSGLTAIYALDRRCPRLFGFAEWSDYVYIGTTGAGVWRKWITGSTWTNYSTGITDLNIKDLTAYNGLLGAVTDEGSAYIRHTQNAAWTQYSPAGFTNNFVVSGEGFGIEYLTSGILAEASSLDRTYGINGAITIGFTIPSISGMAEFEASGMANRRHDLFPASGNLSWVTEVALGGVPVYTQQIVITRRPEWSTPADMLVYNPYDIAVIDLETNWEGTNIISVFNGKKTWIEMPTYSGVAPNGDWGDCNGIGGIGAGIIPATSPTILVAPPPPDDAGIYYTENGYEVISAVIQSKGGTWFAGNYGGGFTFEDDTENEGRAYGYGLDFPDNIYEKYVFHLASGLGPGIWYDHSTYNVPDPGDPYSNVLYAGQFYKTGENSFRLTSIDTDGRKLIVETCVGTINGSTVDITDYSTSIITNYYLIGHSSLVEHAETYNGGRYYACVYGWETVDAAPFGVGVAVVDLSTGSITYNNPDITPPESNGKLFYRTSWGCGVHNLVCAIFHSSPCVDGGWDGYDIYSVFVEKHTGDVNISHTQYKPPTPPYECVPKDRGYAFYLVTDHTYMQDSCTQACENPATGVGYAHTIATFLQDYWKEDLTFPYNHEYWRVVTFFNITLETPGGESTVHVWNDTYQDMTNFLYGDIPLWAKEDVVQAYPSALEPTCSRNYDMTPGVMSRLVGGSFHKVLVDPGSLSVLHNFQDYDGYGVNHIYPMMDDVDNTLYANVGGYYTVGYNLDGEVKKVFFPNDGYKGTPITDKMLINQGTDTSTMYFYIPRFTVSGREVSSSKYLILNHDSTILPSGLFIKIYNHNKPMYLDTAKNIPTVIYTKPYLDDFPSELMGVSFLNEQYSFTVISPGGGMGVHDVRTFDLTDDLGLFPASGLSTSGFLDRYVGVAGGHLGAVMFNSTFDREGGAFVPYTTIASGNITHLDFTNNDPDPYIFVSASGIGASGIFMQRDKASFGWHDYSATLPSGVPISIIRADDRM